VEKVEALLLRIIEGQERTDRKLDVIQDSITHIEEEIVVIKSDVKMLQDDVKVLKGDIKELKATTYRIEEHQEKTIESLLRHIKKKVDGKNNLTIN
jgi:chromosome segregation ATPase